MTGDGVGAPAQDNGKQAQVHALPAALSRLVVEQAPFGLVLVDDEGRIRWANDGFRALLESEDDELAGRSIDGLIRYSGFLCDWRDEWVALEEGWEPARLAADSHADGRLVLVSATPVEQEHGGRLRLLSVIDPGESPAALEPDAWRQLPARLPNMWLFEDRLRHALERADRAEGHVGMMVLRLDDHAALRESLSVAAFEALVARVEQRLARTLRREDSLIKLRPGCWGVLIEPPLTLGGLQVTVMRCLEAMEPPFWQEMHPTLLTLSAGVSIYPEDGELPSQLLASAETALERAGPSGHAFFDEALRHHLDEQLAFRQLLQDAVLAPEGHFQLLYQPQLELATGRCVGLEALLRWQHPRDGLLAPADFLPVVAELGEQVRLDRWVIATVIAQHAAWREAGSPLAELDVAVNVDGDLLDQATFDRRPLDLFLRQQGLEPGWLSLEFGQQGLIDHAAGQAHLLRRLGKLGIGLVANDIGASPVDLPRLASLPVSRVKLSPALMAPLAREGVLEALLRCFQALGIEVVLVGIETPGQLEAVRALGASLGQGHLLGAPQAPDDLAGWWEARPATG
ncbi:Phytochrome-like protein cph2 [Halomonas sp. THAF12]|uniref:EAL domain-containing protein n=1 Tax=Halomonas sp. THAF12 TaxID=2587849 RepID=UPI001267EAAA|nr:EAL domain-containing protein [Halomonas sp. THAF12]QFT86659.1 Phytochrome-like protein cph2 [Halomonas sp. THAF12]